MSGSWAASIRAALTASLGRPRWWVMALAAFLVRGGIFIVLLPLVSLPSAPSLATAFAPTIEGLAIGRQSLETALVAAGLFAAAVGILAVAAYTGTWLDSTLAREAERARELDLRVQNVAPSVSRTMAVRLAAHVPTFLALGYGTVRLVLATYQELLAPGNPDVAIALRVIARAPDAVVVAVVAWLIGEAIGGLAARRAAEGETVRESVLGAIRDLIRPRGVATLVVTDAVVLGVVLLLSAVVGRAVDHVRADLFDRVDDGSLAAGLLLFVTTWVLALAALGATLAWRATVWTIEAAPRRAVTAAARAADAAHVPGEAATG